MSISTVITQIKATLQTISPAPKKIYTSPAEAMNLADFPCIVIALPDNQQMQFINDFHGWSTHQYSLLLYVFVGTVALTQYDKLQTLAMEWPDKLRNVLTPDNIKITGSVVGLGGESDSLTANYAIGTLAEFGENFYGLRVTLPIWERTRWG